MMAKRFATLPKTYTPLWLVWQEYYNILREAHPAGGFMLLLRNCEGTLCRGKGHCINAKIAEKTENISNSVNVTKNIVIFAQSKEHKNQNKTKTICQRLIVLVFLPQEVMHLA